MRLLLALILLSASTAMGKEVLGRGCGEMMVNVGITLLDATTKKPVVDAKVTFYGKRDRDLLRNIAARKAIGDRQPPEPPKGITCATDSKGKLRIKCCFDYSQAIYAIDDKVDECYPIGVFEVEHVAFESISIEATKLYPSAPYLGALPEVTIELKKKDNQAIVPKATSVTSAATAAHL
jgi:hypothetical protein